MKITIEYDDMISSVEFGEFDIHEFTDHLRGLLHTVWPPEQVNEIMPTEERLSYELAEVRKLGYDEGYEEGHKEGKSGYQKVYAEGLKEGKSQGYEDGYEKGLEDGKESLGKVYNKGYDEGYKDGEITCTAEAKVEFYEKGYAEGEAANAKGAEAIYDEGCREGYDKGFEKGKFKGYEEGYGKGYEEGLDKGFDEGKAEGRAKGHEEAIGFVEGYAERKAANTKPAETTDDLQDCIREGKENAEKSNILCKQDSSNIL